MVSEDGDGQLKLDKALIEQYNTVETPWIQNSSDDTGQLELQPQVQYNPTKTPVPMTFIVARTINHYTAMQLLRVLLDSGGDAMMAHEQILPKKLHTNTSTKLTTDPISSIEVLKTKL